jgi:CIC family chloride channel protein
MTRTSHPAGTRDQAALLLRALAAGLVGGACALVLRFIITELPRMVWPHASDLVQAVSLEEPARRVLVPVIGAALAGAILSLGVRWSKSASGWDVLEAVVLRNGVLPLRSTLVRVASALVTQAAAAPVGKEGPIVLMSATAASALGQRLGVPTRQLRVLAGCGIAAGLACAYNAPVGAALFTMEIIFGSFALEVFAPLVVASVTATVLTWATFGRAPVFEVPSLAMASPWEVFPHAVLGLLGGAVAAFFLLALRTSAAMFSRSRLPRPAAMALAGLACGILMLWFPELVGNGRDAIGALLHREWALGTVLALLALRLIVTPLTVGSGAVGGVFTPTLFIGAMLGQAFGSCIVYLAPGLHTQPGAYALTGMACLLAGTTHAPMTATLMVFEMTLDYNVVVPLLLGSAIASVVATRFSATSVYTEALQRKASSLTGDGSRGVAALRVGDLMRPEQVVVAPECPAPRLFDTFVSVHRNHLYLVDAEQRFMGAVNLHDLNAALRDGPEPDAVLAKDLARARFETTTLDEPVLSAMEKFERQECERLPVLTDAASRRLLGTISKRDILSAWARERLGRSELPSAKG